MPTFHIAIRLPENHGTVMAALWRGFTVGAKGDASHALRICFERLADRLAAGDIPEDRCPIVAARSEGSNDDSPSKFIVVADNSKEAIKIA